MDLPEDAGFHSWGPAAARLLRTMRLEASRSGHGEVLPAHALLAVLDQPEVHQALRALRQRPDVYAMRARLGEANLVPGEFSDDTPLSRLTVTMLEDVRAHTAGEDAGLLYLLVLKLTLANQACRILLGEGGLDTEVLDRALAHLS